jgi:site-specific recombinase XerD
MRVSDQIDPYLRDRVLRHELTPLTARNHRSALGAFAVIVGEVTCEEVSYHHVERWLVSRRFLCASTRRSQFSALRSFFRWLQRRHLIDRNPTDDVPAPKNPRSVPRALAVDDVARLLAACPDHRARAVVWLMVGLGLRCCEVAHLELGEWDRGRDLITVTGKGEHQRTLPVPAEVSAALAAYILQHPALCGPVVRSYRRPNDGLEPDTISHMVQQWMVDAGLKRRPRDGVSAHSLRHTCASDVLDACHDLRVVQQMLGHQHLATTAIYLRRADLSQMRDAMAGRRYRAKVEDVG